jgi:coupling of ubiquitin conjugation to ER degradation protein 1
MASSDEEEAATLSIPSLAFVAFLSFFIIRYFISSRSSEGAAAANRARQAGQRFTTAQVEQVAQMFPQLSRRDIMWDLQRNGGSVAATTERVLGGRGLERVRVTFLCVFSIRTVSCFPTQLTLYSQAPPSFQPVVPVSTNAVSTAAIASVIPKAAEPDLITRYNLQSRISAKGKEREEPASATGWAPNKEKRQEMLQRRRDEMILAARRKIQERDQEASGSC